MCVHGGLTYEQCLSEGLWTERRLFHMTFVTADQTGGAWNEPVLCGHSPL